MGKEISGGTMLGIILISLAAVIGISFMVFSIAKGIAGDGVVGLQENMGQVTGGVLEDYDQGIITGTQVISAYKTFKGKPIAILVNTQATTKGVKTSKEHKDLRVFEVDGKKYINYNALLSSTGGGKDPMQVTEGGVEVPNGVTSVVELDGGVAQTKYGYAVEGETGKIQMDSNVKGFSEPGSSEYISSNSKYTTNLIKDVTGNIQGIMITELEK